MAANSGGSAKPKKRRGPGRPFQPGDPRINLSGRPKTFKDFTEAHRDLVPEARAELLAQLEHKDPYVRQGAIKIVYERAFGKAAQPITGEGGEGPAKFDGGDLLAKLQKLLEASPGSPAAEDPAPVQNDAPTAAPAEKPEGQPE